MIGGWKTFPKNPVWSGISAVIALAVAMLGAAIWIVRVESSLSALCAEVNQLVTEVAEERRLTRNRINQVESRLDALEEDQEGQETGGIPIPFSKWGRVRCPGGGDWLGRERNRRETHVEFEAPQGQVILEPAHVRVVADNRGGYGPIEYRDHNDSGEAMSVRVHIWCDPENIFGAAGGWMEIELYGRHRRASE